MAEVTTPYSAVFKTFLSHVETAWDLIELYPPPSLIKVCKLETFRPESGDFMEGGLHPYFNDIFYSLETTNGCGYVYVLIEHQNLPDKYMSFCLICYAIAAMRRHPEAGDDTLPLVVPMLFYHGKQSPRQGSMSRLDRFENSGTAPQFYSTSFPLVGATAIPDDEITQHRSMVTLTLVQKHIRQRGMTQLLSKPTRLSILKRISGQ